MWGMTESKLSNIISKYQLPMDNYLVEVDGAFGRGGFFWVIKNQSTNQKYLFGMYSIFEIKS